MTARFASSGSGVMDSELFDVTPTAIAPPRLI
jgi:hypothetical protein